MKNLKILTVITESVLEKKLAEDFEALGAHGYTAADVRGKGSRGLRNAGWDNSANIKFEVVCPPKVCDKITEFLQEKYFDDYAMITYSFDATVQRNDKF